MNIYLRLTGQFNDCRLRAILSGGQAVVLHRLAIMSKDGDWILREDAETLAHILSVLEQYGARYRFGAPLDLRWMQGGWSAHFEFMFQGLRVRTDFVTRPPRLAAARLSRLWREQEGRTPPFLDVPDLIETKKTNREKDYAVIGELARLPQDVFTRLMYSRSARELMDLAEKNPGQVSGSVGKRPALGAVSGGLEALEVALDAERRTLMHANEKRLSLYMAAAGEWERKWPKVSNGIARLSLTDAHQEVVAAATGVLPFTVPGGLL
jgi:hypothetical protein